MAMENDMGDELYHAAFSQPEYLYRPHQVYDSPQQQQDLQHIDDEPLYVNAKQYFRILKRRVARSRLEEVHRLSRQRKPYLHESRHKHAMRRPRGPGGRFLTAEEIAAQKRLGDEPSASTPADGDGDDGDEDDAKMDHSIDDAIDMDQHGHQPLHLAQDRNPFFAPVAPSPSFHPMPTQMSQLPSHPHSRHLPHTLPSHSHHHHQHSLHPQKHSPQMPLFHQLPKALPINPGPLTLTSPYGPTSLHHVPHPHAHARHHHSNLSPFHLYNPDSMAPSANPDMQRRTEEIIQFGGPTN